MASIAGDTSGEHFSSETRQLLSELEALLAEATEEVARIRASTEMGNKLSRQNAKVQDNMAAMRVKTRELEILAEEADR
jgi:F0F1-type ATP synthase membrane subunit b/b'